MIALSQRDPRWSKQQLGTSNTTIGGFGCTITSIAMLIGTTPDVVNRELKRVGGYANGNLVIWSKVPVAFPQLIFIKRVNYYNNDDVKANLPCLVEVDFDGSPNTFGNHWIVFIGNQRLLDPWTGQDRPTSTYPILKGYAIYKKKIDSTIETTGPETTTSEIPQTPPSEAVIEPTPTPEITAVEEPAGGEEVQPSVPVDTSDGSDSNGSDSSTTVVLRDSPPDIPKPVLSVSTFDIFIQKTLKKIWSLFIKIFK